MILITNQQVAQGVVSDLIASPLGISGIVDPDDIIDSLVAEIRATLKIRLHSAEVLLPESDWIFQLHPRGGSE